MKYIALSSLAPLLLCVAAGCSTVSKVNNTIDKAGKTLDKAGKAADNIAQLAKSFDDTLKELKASAKTATTTAPAQAANVPAISAKATGNVNIATAVPGKSGTADADMDGSGTKEPVQVFTADSGQEVSPSGIRTLDFGADNATTFLAWKGDEESGDGGRCYLGWEASGKAWFIVAECGAATADVCSIDTNSNIECRACNAEGECNACDTDKSLSECKASGE
jgi:hypothetical protein